LRSPRLRIDPRRLDRIVSVVLAVGAQLGVWLDSGFAGHRVLDAVIALLVTGSIALRRRFPFAVGLVVLVGYLAEVAFVDNAQNIPLGIAYLSGLYALAVWTSPRRFGLGLGLLTASYLAAAAGPRLTAKDTVPFAVATVVVMLLVRRVVGDRERKVQLAERERDLAAREAVVAERARIARELHDVVAHSVSVMVVQSQAGPRLLADPERVRAVFGAIETSGREALVELRRLLGVLRAPEQQAATVPQPGLDALGSLIEQVSQAGLRVDLRVEGEPASLPPGVDLSAYRIVQEALTNTLKHAGRAEAEVIVRYQPARLELEILDNGTGPREHLNGFGHGLVGMRERVALYGGQLEAGGRDGHGFAVRARLPLGAEAAG
jgi:signal transduction histidine kinase